MPQIILPIDGARLNTGEPELLYTAGMRPHIAFDQTDDEIVEWSFPVPANYSSALAINVAYCFASETSGVVRVRSQIMCAADGIQLLTDGYDTLEDSGDVTIPGTAGLRDTVTYTPSFIDSIAADSHMSILLGRENATSGSNAAGDMLWFDAWLTYTAA